MNNDDLGEQLQNCNEWRNQTGISSGLAMRGLGEEHVPERDRPYRGGLKSNSDCVVIHKHLTKERIDVLFAQCAAGEIQCR